METFVAKHMQLHKDILDVEYTVDDLETNHALPETLQACYEAATFATNVLRSRKPSIARVANQSAHVAGTKSSPSRSRTSFKTSTSSGSKPKGNSKPRAQRGSPC